MPSILKGFLSIFHFKYEGNDAINTVVDYLDLFIKIIAILIVVKVIVKVLSAIVERFFKKQSNLRFGMNEKKANTLSELIKNILRYALYFFAAFSIVETIWPNASTTIALTSVFGVAVGFGSQNLVKDIISGFFILFEDQFAVGDYVTIEGLSGIVEVLGLRTTQIRDFSGDIHILPNGSITKVTNKTRGSMRALVEINLSYEEDVDIALNVLDSVASNAKKEIDFIVDGPEVIGITGFAESGVIIRMIARTEPLRQMELEAELRRRIKKAFDEKNLKLGHARKLVLTGGGISGN